MINILPMLIRANHQVYLQRAVWESTPTGGRKQTGWADIDVFRPTWVQPTPQKLRVEFHQRKLTCTHCVYFAKDPGAKAEDRLRFGTRVFKVLSQTNPGELGNFWRVETEEKL